MVRYIARPPVALDRLAKRSDGLITYRMKKKYRDGTEMILFFPLELIEKLAALVPRPRAHTTRYHGLFAPHSKNRS
jgi:Putative transposase